MKPSYNRAAVKVLLPAIWDDDWVWGLERPNVPDPDMPRGSTDPSHSNTLWVCVADIHRAWAGCSLTDKERFTLWAYYAVGLTEQEIARRDGSVRQSVISRRIEAAVGKLTAWLNGERYVDGYEALGLDVIV